MLKTTGLENLGASVSRNPMGLQGLLQGQLYFIFILKGMKYKEDLGHSIMKDFMVCSVHLVWLEQRNVRGN
jgi:hypothetical protein